MKQRRMNLAGPEGTPFAAGVRIPERRSIPPEIENSRRIGYNDHARLIDFDHSLGLAILTIDFHWTTGGSL